MLRAGAEGGRHAVRCPRAAGLAECGRADGRRDAHWPAAHDGEAVVPRHREVGVPKFLPCRVESLVHDIMVYHGG